MRFFTWNSERLFCRFATINNPEHLIWLKFWQTFSKPPPTCYDNRAHWSDLQPSWRANDGFSLLSCVYRLEELVWQISFTHTEDRDQQKEEQILNQRPQATFPYWAFPTPPPGWAAVTGWQELGGKWLAASSPGARPLNDSLKEL